MLGLQAALVLLGHRTPPPHTVVAGGVGADQILAMLGGGDQEEGVIKLRVMQSCPATTVCAEDLQGVGPGRW